MNHQCSARWFDVQKCSPARVAAVRSSPSTSRCGPISMLFQCESALRYIWNPSWCSLTGMM